MLWSLTPEKNVAGICNSIFNFKVFVLSPVFFSYSYSFQHRAPYTYLDFEINHHWFSSKWIITFIGLPFIEYLIYFIHPHNTNYLVLSFLPIVWRTTDLSCDLRWLNCILMKCNIKLMFSITIPGTWRSTE